LCHYGDLRKVSFVTVNYFQIISFQFFEIAIRRYFLQTNFCKADFVRFAFGKLRMRRLECQRPRFVLDDVGGGVVGWMQFRCKKIYFAPMHISKTDHFSSQPPRARSVSGPGPKARTLLVPDPKTRAQSWALNGPTHFKKNGKSISPLLKVMTVVNGSEG